MHSQARNDSNPLVKTVLSKTALVRATADPLHAPLVAGEITGVGGGSRGRACSISCRYLHVSRC